MPKTTTPEGRTPCTLAIADSDPKGNGNEIVVVSLVGLLLGGALVYLGTRQGAPPVGISCNGTPPTGTVCDPATGTYVPQHDGGSCVPCYQEGVTCCAPWG